MAQNVESKPVLGAVVVTFHPDLRQLQRLIDVLASQLSFLVVVDNTPAPSPLTQLVLPVTVEVLAQGTNTGIAEGFNLGMRRLAQHGCEYFFLSDQDSSPADDIIAQLLAAQLALAHAGRRVAAVGAMFVDPRDGRVPGFSVYDWRGPRARTTSDATGYVPASFLISSGSLIPRTILDEVGSMDAGLFIDLVDVEWCFRARSRGFEIFGVPSARMTHAIGDDLIAVAPRWTRVSKRQVHSPTRAYFQVRNILLLCGMPHVPLHWKLWNLLNVVAKAYVYLLLVDAPRGPYLRSLGLGLRHGLRGRRGGPP